MRTPFTDPILDIIGELSEAQATGAVDSTYKMMAYIKAIYASGIAGKDIFFGTITTGGSATSWAIDGLAGLGDHFFYNSKWYALMVYTTDQAAPIGEWRAVTDYDTDGTFTSAAFSAVTTAGDQVYLIPSYIYLAVLSLGNMDDAATNSNLSDITTTSVHAKLSRMLTDYTNGRAGYLDELSEANIPADVDTLKTNLGVMAATATADSLADIATTTAHAKLSRLLLRFSADAFAATINGASKTDVESMFAGLASYFVAAGAAFSASIGGSARTAIDTALAALDAEIYTAGHTLKTPNTKIGDIARTIDLIIGSRYDSTGDIGTDFSTLITETESSSLDAAGGAVASKTRLGSLVRWIADAVNSGSTGLSYIASLLDATYTLVVSYITALVHYAANQPKYYSEISDTLQESTDTEVTTQSTDYIKVTDILTDVPFPRDLIAGFRVKFDLKVDDPAGTAYAKVYIDDVAVGAEQTDVTGSYVTKSQDLTAVATHGLRVEVWAKVNTAARTAYVKNFRLYYDMYDSTSKALATAIGTSADDHADNTLFGWIDKTYDEAVLIHAHVDSKVAGRLQSLSVNKTSNANAGDVTIATATTQKVKVHGITVRSNGATTDDLTNIAVYAATGKRVTLLTPTQGAKANLAADGNQVSVNCGFGGLELNVGETIVATYTGTGATATDLNYEIAYSAIVDGGYLA